MDIGKALQDLRANLAWDAPKTAQLDGMDYALVPAGMTLREIPEKPGINPQPKRKTGSYALHEEADFIRFVGAHQESGTRIYADLSASGTPKFNAVLNDHGGNAEAEEAGRGGWGDFRAAFGCPLSEDWQAWAFLHGVTVAEAYKDWLSPADFAEFCEDHVHNIVAPDVGQLIDLGRNVVVESTTSITNVKQLDRGQVEVSFKENPNEPQSKDGKLKLPRTLELALPVFRVPGEADPGKPSAGWVKVAAFVRFRVAGNRLLIGVKLDRPELVLEQEFRAMAARIGKETGVEPLYGTAPAARA
jgi:uncharacterized protein YfdQ (DUF2303 family)